MQRLPPTICNRDLRRQRALSDDSPYILPRNKWHVRGPGQHEAFAKRSTRLLRLRADDATFLSVAQKSQKHLPMTTCLKGLRRLSMIRRRLLTQSGSPQHCTANHLQGQDNTMHSWRFLPALRPPVLMQGCRNDITASRELPPRNSGTGTCFGPPRWHPLFYQSRTSTRFNMAFPRRKSRDRDESCMGSRCC